METSNPAEPTPVATSPGLGSNTSSTIQELTKPTETETPSAMGAIQENKPAARVGFQHAPLPFRGLKESVTEPQQERSEGEWANSFAERRSYTGWSIAAASTFTECTEPDLESPGFATDDAYNSDSEVITPAISRTSSIPVPVRRQQSFCPPSRVSSFASSDRYGTSPESKGPAPTLPWQRRPSDMASSPRRSRLSSLNISQPGSGLARDFSHPSPIAEDARSALNSDEEHEEDERNKAERLHEDKGKGVEGAREPEILNPVQEHQTFPQSEGNDDQFHSSEGAHTPDSMSEAGELSSHRPDDGLVQDMSDKVLKHMFGIELGDLPQGMASAAYESISYCLEELSHIITPASPNNSSPSFNHAGRETGSFNHNISIQPAGGDGSPGSGGMGGASPGGDNRKGRPRKRPADGNERDDDEDDNGDGDDGYRQPGGKRQKGEPRLSCPFRKRNPIRFNVREFTSCATQDFPDMPQLKRHIKTIHGKKAVAQLQCPRCKQTFESHEALHEHSTRPLEFMCTAQDERQNSNPEDGITSQIEDLLNGRKANSKVDNWEALWHVLFPNDSSDVVPSPEFIPPTELDEVHQEFMMSLGSLKGQLGQSFDELKKKMMKPDREEAIMGMLYIFQRYTDFVFDKSRSNTASASCRRKTRNHHNLKPGPQHSRRGSATRSVHRIQSAESMAYHYDQSGNPSSMGTPESSNQLSRPPPIQTNTPSPGYHGSMNASPGGFPSAISTNALSPDALTTPINPLTGQPHFPVTIAPPAEGVMPVPSHLGSPMHPQNPNHRRIPTGDSGVSLGQGGLMMSPNAGAAPPNAMFGTLPVRQQGLRANYQPSSAGASPINYQPSSTGTSPINNNMAFFGGAQQDMHMAQPQMAMPGQHQMRPQQNLTVQQLRRLHVEQQRLEQLRQQQQQQQQMQQLEYEQQLQMPVDFAKEPWSTLIQNLPAQPALGGHQEFTFQLQPEVRVQPPPNPASRLNSDHSPRPENRDGFLG
ncbi:hypothetical protein QBC43DRAFT_123629 [Cladorrhinum sp. PSN259]|nr:hypothetical protein QBC43DRAFT_123629 [Cladorrhinum sp. PSN259]